MLVCLEAITWQAVFGGINNIFSHFKQSFKLSFSKDSFFISLICATFISLYNFKELIFNSSLPKDKAIFPCAHFSSLVKINTYLLKKVNTVKNSFRHFCKKE